jgi:hypothetical protein
VTRAIVDTRRIIDTTKIDRNVQDGGGRVGGMDVVRRVHVAPLGYEYDRILEPARTYGADVLYALVDVPRERMVDGAGDGTRDTDRDRAGLGREGGGGGGSGSGTATGEGARRAGTDAAAWVGRGRTGAPYHEDLLAALGEAGVEVRLRAGDLYDVYDVLGAVTTLAARHAGDDVRVNVSTGGELAAVGATVACMDVSTEATAYYVHPDERAHDGTSAPATRGFADVDTLPTYPVDSPTPDQVAVMRYLREANTAAYTPKKRDVIEHAKEAGLGFLADDPPANRQGEFRRLNAAIVDPLVADGYVTVADVGRRKELSLTRRGEQALRAFRHKLESGSA